VGFSAITADFCLAIEVLPYKLLLVVDFIESYCSPEKAAEHCLTSLRLRFEFQRSQNLAVRHRMDVRSEVLI